MRIIGGELRRVRLEAPRGLAVRPTSDRLREALFEVLGELVIRSRMWDACAGTGAVGLEALSRGASHVLFSEPAAPALRALRANLERCGLPRERYSVWRSGWVEACRRLGRQEKPLDLLYFDPPWQEAQYERFLAAAESRGLVSASAVVALEHRAQPDLADRVGGFERYRRLAAGSSRVSLYKLVDSPGLG